MRDEVADVHGLSNFRPFDRIDQTPGRKLLNQNRRGSPFGPMIALKNFSGGRLESHRGHQQSGTPGFRHEKFLRLREERKAVVIAPRSRSHDHRLCLLTNLSLHHDRDDLVGFGCDQVDFGDLRKRSKLCVGLDSDRVAVSPVLIGDRLNRFGFSQGPSPSRCPNWSIGLDSTLNRELLANRFASVTAIRLILAAKPTLRSPNRPRQPLFEVRFRAGPGPSGGRGSVRRT